MICQSFRHSDYTMEETGGKEEINLPFLALTDMAPIRKGRGAGERVTRCTVRRAVLLKDHIEACLHPSQIVPSGERRSIWNPAFSVHIRDRRLPA